MQPVAGVPSGCASSEALWLPGAPRRELPARPARPPSLTLSSWETWAFCRYMEYSTAVTIELVPNRRTWPRDGRAPFSMATPSRVSRLEITCDPYAAAQLFLVTVGSSPFDDVMQEVETGVGAKGTGRRSQVVATLLRPPGKSVGSQEDRERSTHTVVTWEHFLRVSRLSCSVIVI